MIHNRKKISKLEQKIWEILFKEIAVREEKTNYRLAEFRNHISQILFYLSWIKSVVDIQLYFYILWIEVLLLGHGAGYSSGFSRETELMGDGWLDREERGRREREIDCTNWLTKMSQKSYDQESFWKRKASNIIEFAQRPKNQGL